jgi:hypothetical protein
MTDRVSCCIPNCRRTFKREPGDADVTIMCGRHWRMGDERMRKREKQLRKRVRWFKRKWDRRQNAIDRSSKADKFYAAWQRASDAAHALWHRVKEDVTIKPALGAEDAPRRRPKADMKITPGQQAVKSLQAALMQAVKKYKGMDSDGLLYAIGELAEESGLEFDDKREPVSDVLLRIAGQGSIDAVALFVCVGADEARIADALRLISERSKDVLDGMVFEGLVTLFEEWAEGEIAAGRMLKTKCQESGRYLYQSVEKKA